MIRFTSLEKFLEVLNACRSANLANLIYGKTEEHWEGFTRPSKENNPPSRFAYTLLLISQMGTFYVKNSIPIEERPGWEAIVAPLGVDFVDKLILENPEVTI